MPRKKQVTLRDLAKLLGLSAHTVSKALRGLPGMSEETRSAALKAAAAHGYRTKDQERSLAVERIPIIPHIPRRFKLIVPGSQLSSRMPQLLLEGLQSKLGEYGHSVDAVVLPAAVSNRPLFDAWVEKFHIPYSDGIFISPIIGETCEQMLLELPLSRVLLNFPPPAAEADSVVWDVGTAIYQSVRHLTAQGHKRILYIGGIQEYRGFRLRWSSFVQAMREAGLETRAEEHMTGEYRSKELWMAKAKEFMEGRRPTSVVVAIGDRALWIREVCEALGKRIPDDISLISLEHELNAAWPELARPVLLIRECGVRAAERMLWRVANPNVPFEHIMLQGGFYKGSTVFPQKLFPQK